MRLINTKEKRGITLLVLVSMMIILIIILGIIIPPIAGTNGIVKNTEKAVTDTEKEQIDRNFKCICI